MEILLCTIGFAGKTAEEFFALLQQAGVERVIDIRQNRGGQLSGYAKHPDLAYLLEKVAHIGYSHEPQLAPAPELLKTYRINKDWPAYESRFLGLMQERGIPNSLDTTSWPSKVALLCSEPGPDKCHRRLVADLLAAHWRRQGLGAEIRHLIAPRAKSSPSRRKEPGSVP